MESAGSVDDPLRPQIGGVCAGRRPEKVLPPAFHPPVEAAPIREVEVCQPRLPLGTKEGGGDHVGLAVVLGHRGHPLLAVLDLEALLVPHREVPVPHEVIAGQVEEGLGEEIEDRVGRQGTEVADDTGGGEAVLGGQHGVEVREPAPCRRCRRSYKDGDGLCSRAGSPSSGRRASRACESASRRAVVRQTRDRIVHGVTTGADKLVSLFEPSAQILRRGKLHRPTEFGALVKIQETEGGIVTEIAVVDGKNDAPLLVPAVEGHGRVFGRPPGLVAVDRGFYSTDGERRVRRGRAWRAGGEARIARLKHCFGMARSRYRGERGMVRTVYWAAIANNLTAIASRVG